MLNRHNLGFVGRAEIWWRQPLSEDLLVKPTVESAYVPLCRAGIACDRVTCMY